MERGMSYKRNVVVYIGISLDGYIATKDDSLEWLLNTQGSGDNGFGEFYDTVETIIMGKRTYDWIMNQEWSELNKTMQLQLKKKDSFEAGISTLLELRKALMEQILQFKEICLRKILLPCRIRMQMDTTVKPLRIPSGIFSGLKISLPILL